MPGKSLQPVRPWIFLQGLTGWFHTQLALQEPLNCFLTESMYCCWICVSGRKREDLDFLRQLSSEITSLYLCFLRWNTKKKKFLTYLFGCSTWDLCGSMQDIQMQHVDYLWLIDSFAVVGGIWGFPADSDDNESACSAGDVGLRCWFKPWMGKMPWRRKWQPIPLFLLGKSHGHRHLAHTVHGVAKSRTRLRY